MFLITKKMNLVNVWRLSLNISGFDSALISDGKNIQCTFCASNNFVKMDRLGQNNLIDHVYTRKISTKRLRRAKVSVSGFSVIL